LPPCSVTITFDDGFYSIYKHAIPILREKNLPCTIYITTYYCVKQNPIFRLAVQYMFWKTKIDKIDGKGLGTSQKGFISIENGSIRDKVIWEIISHGETKLNEDERCHFLRELGNRLGVPYEDIVKSRILSIMSPGEITQVANNGFSIQLHTHRHYYPEDPLGSQLEIQENKSILAPLTDMPLDHFCYPSGLWSENHFASLTKEGIESATTCDPGLNFYNTPKLALKRILDGQHMSHIQFEAEISGAIELIWGIKSAALKFIGIRD